MVLIPAQYILVFMWFRVSLSLLVPFALCLQEPFDFVEETFREYLNHNVDPCEDFYRHACPSDGKGNLIYRSLADLYKELKEMQKSAFWNKLRTDEESRAAIYRTETKSTENMSKMYVDAFISACKSSERRTLVPSFVEKFNEIIGYQIDRGYSLESFPLTVKEKENCSIKAGKVGTIMKQLEGVSHLPTETLIKTFRERLSKAKTEADALSSHLDVDVRRGIEGVRELIEKMVKQANQWLKDTPWARNNNITETVEKITSQLQLQDNYPKRIRDILHTLAEMEQTFLECKEEYKLVEHGSTFCVVFTIAKTGLPDMSASFFLDSNAYNGQPWLEFGLPYYYNFQFANEMASKLGLTGYVVGHEISHTFVDNHKKPEHFPFFSKIAQECIQNQLQKTSDAYNTRNWTNADDFLDENGSDILGLQLAYKIMEDYYGDKIDDKIDRLGVTNGQLFFYAGVYLHCGVGEDSSHAPEIVRTNFIAQHPGFKRAFNCSDNSKMMRSATEECVIYGDKAPETRRKFFSNVKNNVEQKPDMISVY